MAHCVFSSFRVAFFRFSSLRVALFRLLRGVISSFRLFAWRLFVISPRNNARRKDVKNEMAQTRYHISPTLHSMVFQILEVKIGNDQEMAQSEILCNTGEISSDIVLLLPTMVLVLKMLYVIGWICVQFM